MREKYIERTRTSSTEKNAKREERKQDIRNGGGKDHVDHVLLK